MFQNFYSAPLPCPCSIRSSSPWLRSTSVTRDLGVYNIHFLIMLCDAFRALSTERFLHQTMRDATRTSGGLSGLPTLAVCCLLLDYWPLDVGMNAH